MKEIDAYILVSIGLEDVTGNFTTFEPLRVDEVAELHPGAAIWSVKVSAGDCAEVAWLDELVHISLSLLVRHLVDLGHLRHLSLLLLVDLLILLDGLIRQRNEHLRGLALDRLILGLLQQVADMLLLLYNIQKRGLKTD